MSSKCQLLVTTVVLGAFAYSTMSCISAAQDRQKHGARESPMYLQKGTASVFRTGAHWRCVKNCASGELIQQAFGTASGSLNEVDFNGWKLSVPTPWVVNVSISSGKWSGAFCLCSSSKTDGSCDHPNATSPGPQLVVNAGSGGGGFEHEAASNGDRLVFHHAKGSDQNKETLDSVTLTIHHQQSCGQQLCDQQLTFKSTCKDSDHCAIGFGAAGT